MTTQENLRAAPAVAVILHIFPSFAYGGQQARFATLTKGLGAGFLHHVVSLDGDQSAAALLPAGAPVVCATLKVGKTPLSSLANVARFRKLIVDINPHILCTYNWGSIEAVMANRIGAGIPHIHFEDGFGPEEQPDAQLRKRIAARRILLSGSTVVVPSHTLKTIATKRWKLRPDRVRYISNGVDFDLMQGAPVLANARVTVGAVGALRPEKNYQRLIKSFIAADREDRASLTIIGEGPERNNLAAAIKEYNAEVKAVLPGATAAPHEVYRNFDIFALSSDTEQAPLTVLEAMAAGLPVVATNVGDIADMVSDENRAFITPLGDDEAYVNALAHLLQNPHARAQLGAANRKKAKTSFALGPMVESHRALYQSLVPANG